MPTPVHLWPGHSGRNLKPGGSRAYIHTFVLVSNLLAFPNASFCDPKKKKIIFYFGKCRLFLLLLMLQLKNFLLNVKFVLPRLYFMISMINPRTRIPKPFTEEGQTWDLVISPSLSISTDCILLGSMQDYFEITKFHSTLYLHPSSKLLVWGQS